VDKSSIRILVVDDYEPWRRFVLTTLLKQPELEVIGEVSDGLEAVQKAEELQPDLILLDIGLPTLNGIEAARRIRKVSPGSKILFASENRSADITEEALSTGADGYVVKSNAARELLPAVKAVLEGKRFLSATLAAGRPHGPLDPQTGARFHRDNVVTLTPTQKVGITRHEAGFYTDDGHCLDDVTRFILSALKAGYAAIVVATESHRNSLLLRLQEHGVDIVAAIEQGRYISVDAADALSAFMIDGIPDPMRFSELLHNLISNAANAGKEGRIAVFGECVHLLWAQGNSEATIRLEGLWNEEVVSRYNVDVLCGYSLGSVRGGMDSYVYQRICEEHSAVYSR
jgi:DNA-binding NarL/FixJ family response regulator